MPGLAQCRYVQERIAVVGFKGEETVALDCIEPLYFTTQLNRRAVVPAWLSLVGRHSTIPCCYAETLAVRQAGATVESIFVRKLDERSNQAGEAPLFRSNLFQGKRFLITGGGTGLGKIMLDRFVELGADAVICGRRGSVLEETAREIMAKYPGRRIDCFTVDIRVATAVEEMVGEIWAGGPLDGLVNNAAGNFISQTKDLSPRAFDAIANIVLHGTFYTTNACGKRWIAEKRKASVLSILTTWVWTGSPFVVPSAMSKAGVAVMTQSLAVEWGRHGIRLNAIAPGPFPTEGAWARLNPMKDSDDDRYKARNPLGRVGRPSELANMAAFLMSDEVEYINGEVIAIDGAMGIMGNGTFSNMMAYGENDWQRIREQIQSTNAADKAKRS